LIDEDVFRGAAEISRRPFSFGCGLFARIIEEQKKTGRKPTRPAFILYDEKN
jgi:hypothetical protein